MSELMSQEEIDALLNGGGIPDMETESPAETLAAQADMIDESTNFPDGFGENDFTFVDDKVVSEEFTQGFDDAFASGQTEDTDALADVSAMFESAAGSATIPTEVPDDSIDTDVGPDSSLPTEQPNLSGNLIHQAPEELSACLSEMHADTLGEIGNICMGAAATALYSILGRKVSITTPNVECTTPDLLAEEYDIPFVIVNVEYTEGLIGNNLLILRIEDVKIITDIMMGGEGEAGDEELSELHLSAISEAMNQMMGGMSTAMADMLNRIVNISPPNTVVVELSSEDIQNLIKSDSDGLVKIGFKMEIEGIIDSGIMQLMPMSFAKELVNTVLGDLGEETAAQVAAATSTATSVESAATPEPAEAVATPVSSQSAPVTAPDQAAVEPASAPTAPAPVSPTISPAVSAQAGTASAPMPPPQDYYQSPPLQEQIHAGVAALGTNATVGQQPVANQGNVALDGANVAAQNIPPGYPPYPPYPYGYPPYHYPAYGNNQQQASMPPPNYGWPQMLAHQHAAEQAEAEEQTPRIDVHPVQLDNFDPYGVATNSGDDGIGMIMDVPLQITVELGQSKKSIQEILDITVGSVITLDKIAGEPVDIVVNGKMIAKGEVIVIDDSYGVRITEIVSPSNRLRNIR